MKEKHAKGQYKSHNIATFPARLMGFVSSMETYVRDDREVCDAFEDRVPDADVLDPLGARSTALR